MGEARKDPRVAGAATSPGRAPLGAAAGWRLGRVVGVGIAVAGALVVAPAAWAAPPAGAKLGITAALSAVASGKTTLTFTPKASSGTGAYVAVFAQGKGKTSVLVPQTRETGALTAGTKTTYSGLPINAPNGTSFKSVTAYEQTAYNKAVLVAVYAQAPKGLQLPPPGPVPFGGNGSVGGGKNAAQLPKTGAGPFMGILGAVLLVGGGVLATLRPKRRGA